MSTTDPSTDLLAAWRDIWLLSTTSAVLGWDEETGMPAGGTAHRGDQAALLAGLIHERVASPHLGELAQAALSSSDPIVQAHGRHALRAHERARHLPRALVEEVKRVAASAQRAWVDARTARDWHIYEPWLARIVALKRDEARALADSGQEPWEALVDEFEPGARVKDIVPMLDELAAALGPLVQAATSAPKRPDPSVLRRAFPVERQRLLGQMIAVGLGYDLERGRIDLTTHPFCTTLGRGDVRIAVRFHERDLGDGLFATIHEVGHALYEQGVPDALLGTPSGELSSLGLHESQSRLWENLVGRSAPFWRHWLPVLQRLFPDVVADVDLDTFVGAVNAVVPGPIRVGADEVTYNLHIVIRVAMERGLINGGLEVRDLREAWRASYRQHLGITPKDDVEGVLQDGHWSVGFFGYFPTYTLGNLYAAQLWQAARAALPDLDDALAAGRADGLLGWLRTNVHAKAATVPAAQVVAEASGAPLSAAPFIAHLRERLTQHGML